MNPLNKPIDIPGGDAVMTWVELHSSARFWRQTYVPMLHGTQAERTRFHEALNQQRETVARLRAFPADRWKSFAEGAGWTTIACTAWSWCQATTLVEVLDIGRRLDWQPAEGPGEDFAALLLAPYLLPPNRLSDIFRAGQDAFGAALILAARLDPPEFDLPSRNLASLPAFLHDMLASRGLNTTGAGE